MFTTGQSVRYKDFTGFVDFISDDYITICIKSTPAQTKRGTADCCLCVMSKDWQSVISLEGK
jgi:hypothetical protein